MGLTLLCTGEVRGMSSGEILTCSELGGKS
jgi:hypothetical protein